MTGTAEGTRDFFVSFNQADRSWATWIAWVLEGAGYTVFFQDWDFKGNFVLEMDRGHAQSRRTIAILSPDYLTSRFTAPEWAARFAQDATSEHDLLIPVQVRRCNLNGMFAQIVYVDLVGCSEAAARDKLVKRVEGIRLKPSEPPLFPGNIGHETVPERPVFPMPQSSPVPLCHSNPFMADPPYNPVPECAELIAGIIQSSDHALFDLLPELRFGRAEFEVDELSVSYGVKETALRVELKACQIRPGSRLGDDRSKHLDIVAKGGNTWEIKGPKENGILMRRALGSEPLCRVGADGEAQPHVIFELSCRARHLAFKLVGKEAERVSITEARILESFFFNKCLNAERGIVVLSRASLSVPDDTQ